MDDTRMKRILITGGAGFIGSHLCRRFVTEGVEVVCMDNLLTGRLENIEDLFGVDAYTFVRHDVTDFIHVPGRPDITVATRELDWTPKIGADEGLGLTLPYFQAEVVRRSADAV